MPEPVLTPAEMGEADRRTVRAGTPVAVLMERAGGAVARAVRRALGGSYGRRVVVFAGKGNNGGDGLVAARRLRAWGARVDVVAIEGPVDRDRVARCIEHADAVVDAMYGTGFRGALQGDAEWAALEMRAAPLVVAVDIPSGIDGLTGGREGVTVEADLTVCFAARKPGLLFEPGRSCAGAVEVVDIGIDLGDLDAGEPGLGVVTGADVARWLPARAPDAHKWSAGGVLVVAGGAGMTGAAMLAARAAMRAGAGIVVAALPGEAAERASGTEVITRAVPATPSGVLAAAAAEAVLADHDRFAACVVGPGLGHDPQTVAAVGALVAELDRPLVIDADAITALAGDLAPLRVRAMAGFPPVVLTPHAGEYARVAGEPVGPDRVAAARRLAARTGAVVLLKGPGTVVAAPDGRARVATTGGAALATAGSGDVLSGVIGAFLARGASALEAAAAAAWVHGRAAEPDDAPGLVAGDLVERLPAVLRAVP